MTFELYQKEGAIKGKEDYSKDILGKGLEVGKESFRSRRKWRGIRVYNVGLGDGEELNLKLSR